MPERNLVTNSRAFFHFTMILSLVVIAASQVGCTKLRQSSFSDLLGRESASTHADFGSDLSDSASRYVRDPYEAMDAPRAKDQARILSNSENGVVKLTAESTGVAEENCDHGTECDCHKPRTKLKLAHVEPIALPFPDLGEANVIQMSPPSVKPVNNMEPPRGLVSQPLTPILFDRKTREVQTDAPPENQNSLRRKEQWSHEKLAAIETKTNDEFLASDAVEIAKDVENAVVNVDRQIEKPNWSGTLDAYSTGEVCQGCSARSCDGNCTPRRVFERRDLNVRPVMNAEPIVIVATTTKDTIPPFAESPLNDVEPVEVVEQIAQVTEEDLSEQEWMDLFAVEMANSESCTQCDSLDCKDAGCEKSDEPPVQTTTIVANSNDFELPPANFSPTEFQSPEVPVEFEPAENDFVAEPTHQDNDFMPASHNEGVTIELPVISPTAVNRVVSVPDAGFVRHSQPAQSPKPQAPSYTGPAVRFEIIDNTVPWDEKLSETIEFVQSKLAVESKPETRNGLEVNLRLLEVLKRQMSDVEDRHHELSNQEKQYWQHQLDAITLMLNSDQNSDLELHDTAITTLDHLRKAVERLETIADLRVSNGAFCTEISGFGQFKAFATNQFATDQRMLVYVEVENYASVDRMAGANSRVHTQLRGSYAIYDQSGNAVQQFEYPVVNDFANKRRRDFYLHFPIQLRDLPAGQYELKLLVEDLNGNKSASLASGLPFVVR